MKIIGSFLIVAVLVAAMAGCTGISPGGGGCIGGCYILSITSTAGGSVSTPGEGTFTYNEGSVVNLLAEPAEGYQFVNWTGDVGTIANVNAALTAITTSASCSIRANFSGNSTVPLGINYTEAEVEQLIIVLVNDERQQDELTTLSEDALLTDLAREHSAYMAQYDLLTHDRFPGERPLSYNMSPGDARGENLAKIPTQKYSPGPYLSLQEVCEWAVSGWMASEGHRENILEPIFTETGVGVSFSDEGTFTYLYITQIFEGDYY
ncbi:MAG: CAP domain-containing protein [Candidatus Bathyarchaeota archaeon]|nr:CAP domain-containing protein [Candidatus Bathyarchaeota archaeon]